ncbi:aldose 1-epimerase family protein [Lachnoclostridium sp. Marseille-P6806]|uniref:aldose 1-epimerase family protein n=1 Tax=Lachnoclostridium sp. Marseille-P6806 TaxID=2364793 RepID=UPI0010314647|nr:aldose 1-epimerase family protein [Lachnoclostridium sp. Marseille-P6806]
MLSLLSNEQLDIVTSSTGAELLSVTCNGKEYIWQGSKAYWEYHAPVLFPYVGRLTDDRYTYNGQMHKLKIHGFAMDSEFSVVERTDACIVYELQDNSDTYEVFPFHFKLRVAYTLQESTVEVLYTVVNESDEMMHFGIGAHPGFNVPLEDGEGFEDYLIKFLGGSEPDRVLFSDRVLLNGSSEPYSLQNSCIRLRHDLFDNDAIVLQNMGYRVSLESQKSTRKVTLTYPGMPYLGIWHANKTKAPYVCIEPWASLPSRDGVYEDLACKSALIHLPVGEVYTNKWLMEFQ